MFGDSLQCDVAKVSAEYVTGLVPYAAVPGVSDTKIYNLCRRTSSYCVLKLMKDMRHWQVNHHSGWWLSQRSSPPLSHLCVHKSVCKQEQILCRNKQ